MRKIVALSLFFVMVLASVAVGAPKYKLKMATVTSDPHPWVVGANFFADRIAEMTNGEVEVTVYTSGSLGNHQGLANAMKMGAVDMVILSLTPLANVVPECAVFSIPFVFSGYDHNTKAMGEGSPLFSMFNDFLAQKKAGFRMLATGGGGARLYYTTTGPIVKPSDMKGLKMRVVNNPMTERVCKTVGAVPTPLPFGDVYSGLQTGLVDALDSSISGFYSNRFYEVAKYLVKSYQEFIVTHISISDFAWKKIPEKYHSAFQKAAWETGAYITELGIKNDTELVNTLSEKYGVNVNEIDKEAFFDLFKPIQEELASEIPGTTKGLEILNVIRSIDN